MVPGSLSVLADLGFDHMDGNGWGALMVVGMIAFWIAVLVVVVWLVRGGAGGARASGSSQPTALEILDRSLAEGTQRSCVARRPSVDD